MEEKLSEKVFKRIAEEKVFKRIAVWKRIEQS